MEAYPRASGTAGGSRSRAGRRLLERTVRVALRGWPCCTGRGLTRSFCLCCFPRRRRVAALPCGSACLDFRQQKPAVVDLVRELVDKALTEQEWYVAFVGGKTAHSTLLTVNGPTRTVGIVIIFAAVTPPVASCNWTVGSVGLGMSGRSSRRIRLESVTRLAPVSKIIGVVSLPFKVTSTSKTPPLRLISMALLSTDFSLLTSCCTLSSNPRDGPSLRGDFDLRLSRPPGRS